MVAHIEALPAIGMLDWKEFLSDPVEDLVEFLFISPLGLLLLDSFSVENFDRTSVLLEVLERSTFK